MIEETKCLLGLDPKVIFNTGSHKHGSNLLMSSPGTRFPASHTALNSLAVSLLAARGAAAQGCPRREVNDAELNAKMMQAGKGLPSSVSTIQALPRPDRIAT
jgi:hypothetical protein